MGGKKTSVDWIESWIIGLDVKYYSKEFIIRILKEAKPIEKEQIKDAFNTAIKHQRSRDLHLNPEQYFNETYGNSDTNV
jgi:hypothetical protein